MTLEDGLPSSLITSVFQDSKGYIWFGSENGLGKYDGYTVKRFGVDEGVPLSFVTAILEKSDGTLWFSTFEKGAIVYKNNQWMSVNRDNGFPSTRIFDMAESKNGNILFGTEKGLIEYDGTQFINLTVKHLWPGRVVRSVYLDREDRIWLGTLRGLLNVNGDDYQLFDETNGLIHNRVLSVGEDLSGRLWVGTADGLSMKNVDEWESFTEDKVLTDNVVFCLSESSGNRMWFGTQKGLTLLEKDQWLSITEKNSLVSNYVFSIMEDREKNIWIGTQSGVSILKNMNVLTYDRNHGLPGNIVYDVLVTSDGRIWMSCDKGIGYFEKDRWFSVEKRDGPSSGIVYSIEEDMAGSVWLAGDLGIARYENGILEDITDFQSSPSVLFSTVFCDNTGLLWFGTRNKGLYSFDGKGWQFYDMYGELSENNILALYQSMDSTLWVGEAKGKINVYRKGKWSEPSLNGLRLNVDVTGFAEDDEGGLWIGTYGKGIYRLKEDNFTHYSVENGLVDNHCTFLLHKDGCLIVGTKRGLSIFNDSMFRNLTVDDGLGSSGLNQGAVDYRNGILWVGTSRGLSKVQLKGLRSLKTSPLIYIDSVVVNGSIIKNKQNIILNYNQNNLDFNFTGIYYSNPESIVYATMLEGVDDSYVKTTARTVSFRGLSHGTYHFRVKAGIEGGIWSENEAIFSYTIKPPLWKTPAFIIISQLLLIALGVALFYYGRFLFRIIRDYRSKRLFAHFQLETQIGEGGEGDVFLAWDKKKKRQVALKILHRSSLKEKKIDSFLKNGLICEQLNCPGVVRILERGQVKHRFFIAMEYIKGSSLNTLIQNRILSVKDSLFIYMKLLEILENIHKQGIIHRDLKPENIMVVPDGFFNAPTNHKEYEEFDLKILDFGLAKYMSKDKHSQVEGDKGTPMFLPPEYFLKQRDASSDIDVYSIGVILYMMLTGKTPYSFEHNDVYHLISSILYDTPVPPCELNIDIPSELSEVVLFLIHKDPDSRLISSEQIKRSLSQWL